MASGLHQLLPTLEEIEQGTRFTKCAPTRGRLAVIRQNGSPEFITEEVERIRQHYPNLSEHELRKKARALYRHRTPLTKRDICNVELISSDELLDALATILDCMGMHRAIEEVTGRWELGPVDPERSDESEN